MLRSAISAATALALAVAPIAAQAAPQEVSRTGSQVGETEQLRGTTAWVIAAIVVALLIWGGTELLDDDEASSP